MIREIQRQLMNIYRDRRDGFFVADESNVICMNEQSEKILKVDSKTKAIHDVLDAFLAENVKNCIAMHESNFTQNVPLFGELYDIAVVSLSNYAFVFLHKKNDYDKLREKVEFKAKVIDALTAYQRTIFDAAKMFSMNKNENIDKVIDNSMARAIKVNTAISEMSRNMVGEQCSTTICNLGQLTLNAVNNIKEILKDIDITVSGAENNKTCFCNMEITEKAMYYSVSALLYGRKTGKIEVEFQCVNQRDILSICGKDIVWTDACKDFIYGKRCENLSQDIHTYGYDVLCASNLMEMQGGSFFVETKGNDTKIHLVLPETGNTGAEILRSNEEKYLNIDDAFVMLSDIL